MSDSTVTGAETPEQPQPAAEQAVAAEQPAAEQAVAAEQPAAEQAVAAEQPVAEQAAAAEQSASDVAPEQPATAGPHPRPASARLLRAGAATVAAALVGVVIGIGIIKTQYDDPAPVAAGPSAAPAPTATATPFGAKSNGNHFGSLRDLLLPVPAGFELGPDEGGYGNDNEIGAEQLSAELDEELQQIPKDKRDKLRTYWEGLHVKATGVRTYRSEGDDLVAGLKLRQFNQQEVQKLNEYTAVFSDTGLFRLGPEIPGHPEAHCYLMPAPPSAPLDYLECSAAEGDLLVVMNVEGVAPLPKDKIVALFTAQLDRLARPGASV